MEDENSNNEGYTDQETFFLAAEDQRVFGAGIKRKRVPFVPASTTETSSVTKPNTTVGDNYLSIVLKKQEQISEKVAKDAEPAVCEVCGQPAKESHESSISHQLCLGHSHPPSHLPREHIGMKILGSHGWDPDSRLGLGAAGEGIRVPIKTRIKNDTVGLGVEIRQKSGHRMFEVKEDAGVKRLNVREVRLQEEEGRKRAQKLQRNFYGKELSQYIGPDE